LSKQKCSCLIRPHSPGLVHPDVAPNQAGGRPHGLRAIGTKRDILLIAAVPGDGWRVAGGPGEVSRNGHTRNRPASAGRADDTGIVQGVTQGVVGYLNPRVARRLQIDEVDGQGGKILDIVPLPH
jgi:hypothetical protein